MGLSENYIRKDRGCFLFYRNALFPSIQYCYLGSVLTNNGSLNSAGHLLHDKGMKAMYAILRKVYKHGSCNIRTMVSLFDKMILPIATYNSEIWGTMCFPVNKKNNNFIHLDNRKNPVEDLQVKFCKRVGVSDKTTNWAVKSEVGRYPTTIHIYCKHG